MLQIVNKDYGEERKAFNLNHPVKVKTECVRDPNENLEDEDKEINKPILVGNICPECNKYFENSTSMRKHFWYQHNGKPTKCTVCEKVFTGRVRMLTHVKLVHNTVTKKCPDCTKSFSNETNLRTHHSTVHKGIRFKCEHCDYLATQKGHLKEHIQIKHDGIVYTCDRKYSQKKALKKHKCIETDKKKSKRKSIRNRDHLHQKKTHPNVCPDCGKSFASPKGMVVHYDTIHDGVRFTCNQCEKKFKQIGNLITHRKSIHELVKYNCNKCEYKATQPSHLKKHITAKHEGIKFPCGQCSS